MLYGDTVGHVHWKEDWATSIVDINILQQITLMPKKQNSNESPCWSKRKFNLHIKPEWSLPDSTDDEDANDDLDADLKALS